MKIGTGATTLGATSARVAAAPARATSRHLSLSGSLLFCLAAGLTLSFTESATAAQRGTTQSTTQTTIHKDSPNHPDKAKSVDQSARSAAGSTLTATPESATGAIPASVLEALRSQGGHADTIFQHLDQSNGLVSPVVTSFAQDASGFLWIGTQLGVLRWDGYRLRTYVTQLGVAGALPDSYVNALFCDPKGVLWIGTNSAGLVRYDPATDKFVRYLPENKSMSHLRISSLAADGSGGLWVGTDGGLDHLNVTTGQYDHTDKERMLTSSPETGASGAALEVQAQQRITALLRDRSNQLWVGTEGGLFLSDAAEKHFVLQSLPTSQGAPLPVLSLTEDSQGHIWIGTNQGVYTSGAEAGERAAGAAAGNQPGSNAANESQSRVTLHLVVSEGPVNSLAGQVISSIVEARPGTMWFGTLGQGLVSFDVRTNKSFEILHDIAVPTSLSDDTVAALFRDREGTVWAGTQRGVSYTSTTEQGIRTYFGGSSRKDALTDKDVYSVVVMRNGGPIWLGLSKNGIDLFDRTGKKLPGLRPDPKHPETALPQGGIQGIAQVGDGSVYIATVAGLYHARSDGSGLHRLPINLKPAPAMSSLLYDAAPRVGNKSETSGGRLWIGGNDGLFYLDLPKQTSSERGQQTLVRLALNGQLTNRRITTLLLGPHHNLWVGTENGLNHIDVQSMAVEKFFANPADSSSLASGFISSLLWDQQGRLWVGVLGGGIGVLHVDTPDRFRRIIDGLPSVNVDKLLLGHDGRVWASTDGGIVGIDTKTYAMRAIGPQDGAAITGYWNDSGAELEDGRMIFGGVGGVTSIDPAMLKPLPPSHPVVITDLVVGGKGIPAEARDNPADASANAPIIIEPSRNSMTAEFSALDYVAPQQERYQYRLVGFDKDWIETTADRRLASYTNLPPGTYSLEIRASNRSGIWGPTWSIPVLVIPAWNQTAWFWIFVVVLSILVLLGCFLLATAYLRRQRRELAKEVARRTAELEQMTIELQESQQKLERMAYSDSLTGLPNRRMFTEYFRRLLALKRRQKGAFALLMIDLDEFKEVNDTYGHDAGDALLKEVARRLSLLVRESDCFARLGGDEFAMLLAESNQINGVEQVCRKIIESFEEPIHFQGIALKTTPSIGVVLYPGNGESQDKLYKMADIALYRVKSAGGNSWQWCDEDVEPKTAEPTDKIQPML